ncbi:Aspartic protease PEP3 [Trichoderma lentiforme]|uniref:Aspartic protease PEP3 n=1 Tax=Trichoderma lentiforme TaxID=1567552 RepID=A0A9P5CDV3_9HYPO|nr:Aspartic protease PEP3 [Trichoderma lentiforme]
MHSRLLLAALFLGFIALVSASAIPVQKRSFKVERRANPNFTGNDGLKALGKAYRKFGWDMPQNLKDALEVRKAADTARRAAAIAAREAAAQKKSRRSLLDILGELGVFGNNGNADANGDDANANANGNAGAGSGKHHHHGQGNGQGQGQGQGQAGNGQGQAGGNQTQAAPPAQQPASGQTGSVTNTPEGNDVEFLSPVNIGGQTLNLDFDTGSSDLWVFNTQMDPQLTAGHTLFDPTKSKTFQEIQGAQFLVQYGDGSGAEGTVGTDVVNVGGAVFNAQAVEIATEVTQQFVDDQQNDGLMGLAFSTLNTVQPQQQKTFLDNVAPSLAEPVFTADLKKGAPGTYTFGAIDSTAFQGDLTFVDVDNSQGFWQFSSESFAVDGGATQQATAGGQAIADTGTTLLLADPIIVNGYYSQVQGAVNDQQAGGFTIPCDAQLPDLDLDVGGKYVARISGSDLNFSPVSGNTCFGGLQATTQGGLGVYGDIFFKSQFVAFNIGNNTLGLAPHA